MVETALTFPVLLLLLLGAVDLGDMIFKANQMTNAARAAAQYAAMNGGNYTDCTGALNPNGASCTSTSGIVLAASNDAPDVANRCNTFAVKETTSCTCSGGGSACDTSTGAYTCTSGKGVVTVTIDTSGSCPGIVSVPNGFLGSYGTGFSLSGHAQQEVLQ
jgi:Flp pilus assembly protein TadG